MEQLKAEINALEHMLVVRDHERIKMKDDLKNYESKTKELSNQLIELHNTKFDSKFRII
jgi:septal ring factor EnvC (AmiA/AmiB activator)